MSGESDGREFRRTEDQIRLVRREAFEAEHLQMRLVRREAFEAEHLPAVDQH